MSPIKAWSVDFYNKRRNAPSVPKPFPTGREVAELSGLPVIVGAENCYNFITRTIMLESRFADSNDVMSVLVAAHELYHSRQSRWVSYAMILTWRRPRWNPLYWWRECTAWEFAAQFLADLCVAQRRDAVHREG
jgi:hypothetical protein